MESLSMQLMPVFDWLLRTTLQAALLFCLIMLIKLIVGGRLPIRWHYCLWLLLLVRLATPWLPESKISIFNWVPRPIQEGRIIESLSQPQDTRGMGFYMRGGMTDRQETESEAITFKFARMLPLLWLAGGIALAIYVGASNFRLWWLVTRERPLTDQKILDLLEDCKAEMSIRNILGIVTTDKVRSAALFGFVRPRLLLPAGMVENLSRQELRYVFLHELGHLRRRDIYVGWLMSLLQVLHWFNPLVWLAFYRMQSDRELACDALVLSYARSGESKEYGRTIVSLLERFSRPQRLPSMAGISENKSQLKRRIKMIAKFKKTSRTRGTSAMLLLIALACIILTNAYVAKADFIFGIPENLGAKINSSKHDINPGLSRDGLTINYSRFELDFSGFAETWVAKRTTKVAPWDNLEHLGLFVDTSDGVTDMMKALIDALGGGVPGWFPADDLEAYFYHELPGGYGGYDLYVIKRETVDSEWSPPENLGPNVNTANNELASTISPDGLTLYFSSFGRPDGYGRSDLYITTRPTRSHPWGEAKNLGAAVNSSSWDIYPIISSDGLVLFFVSGRSDGLGGEDIWMTKRKNMSEPWEEAVNLGAPVNTSYDDYIPYISSDGSTLYLSSNRPGGYGGYDIWQVQILPVIDLNADGKVDTKDLRKLAQYWGQDEPSCDIAPLPNGDGIVDEKDLNLFAEHLLKELRPVAHWRLDEAQGDVAVDSMGGNDGALHGNPVWQPDGGAVGGALQLDGVDDYVSTDFGLDPTQGSFSAFAWIKSETPGQVIISQIGGPLGTRWLWTDPSYGRLITWLMHPTFDPLMSEITVTDGLWHHLGLVYDLDNFRRSLYIDGVRVAKDNDIVGGEPSSGGLYFGADKMLGQNTFFSGLIDDIRIYDEVLSAEEVTDLAR